MKLYEISDEIKLLEDTYMEAIDEETGEIIAEKWNDIQCREEELRDLFKSKTENIVKYYQNIQSDIAILKSEEERLNKRRKTLEKKIEWLKKYLLDNMVINGYTKLNTPYGNISTRKSNQVHIDTELIPKDERYYKTTIVEKYDKNEIKKLIKNGEDIKGVIIEENISINVK